MGPIKCPKQYCGEVFITNNYLMMLECKYCTEEFVPYDEFLKHIFDEHFDNIEVYESDDEDDNEDEMSIRSPHESVGEAPDRQCIEHELNELEKIEQSTEISTSSTTNRETRATTQPHNTQKHSEGRVNAAAASENVRAVTKMIFAIEKQDKQERKYKCKFCGNGFYTMSARWSHEKRHTHNKSHCCKFCQKRFYMKTELNLHMRWHTGERPFVCAYCGSRFVSSSALTTHSKSHLNERKYKCDQCDKSYFRGDQLKKHRTVHTGERPYKCNICLSTFTRDGSLRNHKKLHENALRYECTICSKRFNQKPGLIWHKKRYHNILTGENIVLVRETNETLSSNENKPVITWDRCDLNCIDKQSLLNHQHAVHTIDEGEEIDVMLEFL